MIILFNKPYNVLCQFTDPEGRTTLSDYIPVKNVYAAGRLDYDSEGLVILTDDGKLQSAITHPDAKCKKTYWVQIEGNIDAPALQKLATGVNIKDGFTAPAKARVIGEPDDLWPRDPPIRFRKEIPDMWLELTITEGKNRQVRHMTAAVGYPTLRLIRYSVGPWNLGGLQPGQHMILSAAEIEASVSKLTFVNSRRKSTSTGARRSRGRSSSTRRTSQKNR